MDHNLVSWAEFGSFAGRTPFVFQGPMGEGDGVFSSVILFLLIKYSEKRRR